MKNQIKALFASASNLQPKQVLYIALAILAVAKWPGAFLGLSIAVFWHELGHLLAARWCGIKVNQFAIGFGPSLYSYTSKSGMVWGVRAFLLGGFVEQDQESFKAASPKSKAILAVMGPVFSLLPLIYFEWLAYTHGRPSFTVILLQGFAHINPTKDLGGPIMIGKVLTQAAEYGLWVWFKYVMYISVSLGFFNLLPILPFDGGRIAMAGLETILPSKWHDRIENLFGTVGTVLIVLLMIFVFYQDIAKLIGGLL